MSRHCATCARSMAITSYTAAQYSLGPGISRCHACFYGCRQILKGARQDVPSGSPHEAEFTMEELRNPFACSGFRTIVKGRYTTGELTDVPCIRKTFRMTQVFWPDFFCLDIEAVDKALELVDQFNQLQILPKPILVNIPRVAPESYALGSKALIEMFIENWTNFNSNTSWADNEGVWAQAMQALSHFSYHITDRQYVLCDLQGGIHDQQIILSDPVILSKDREYGVTDLGPSGISTFF